MCEIQRPTWNVNNSVCHLRSAWVIELHACVRFNIYALRFLTDDDYQTWSLFYNHRQLILLCVYRLFIVDRIVGCYSAIKLALRAE